MTATFEAGAHIYEADGVVVPSVSQVLELAGICDVSKIPLHYLERAGAVGTAVHQACEFLDQDDLDLESVAPEIVGYVLGYQRFREATGFTPIEIERQGVTDSEPRFGYCVDRVGILAGMSVILDIKTASKPHAWWGIQTAGYADALRFEGERAAVHVSKDGKYKLLAHEDDRDFEAWRAALQVAHWKLAHGGKL